MKQTLGILFCLATISCKSPEKKAVVISTPLQFLKARGYQYSTSKTAIPRIVLDSLRSFDKEKFNIGDETDSGKIDLGDAHVTEFYYDKLLRAVLLNDSICMVTYEQGGFGSNDVVDFVKYKGKFKHLRYRTSDTLTDTLKLYKYLATDPKPETKQF